MKSIKCELKYCEGCGTLQLRPVKSVTNHCAICERMLARFRFPRAALAGQRIGLPSAAWLGKIPLAVCSTVPGGRSQ
jgi:hypothetical protein